MIDIHTHILPCIDDGSESMTESILMAKIAVESGVDTIIVTPHCNVEGTFHNYYGTVLIDRFEAFAEMVKREQIPLDLKLGMEVYGTEEVPDLLRKGKLITLNHSRYLLLEFAFQKDIPLMEFLLYEVTYQGFHPIIAHPERYPFVQRYPDMVYDWIERGCSIQVNKGSILGSFGRRARNTSLYLLENNLVSFIASDAHSPYQRTTDLSEVYLFVKNNFSEEYADILLKRNPRCLIEDNDLVEPLQSFEVKDKRWFV